MECLITFDNSFIFGRSYKKAMIICDDNIIYELKKKNDVCTNYNYKEKQIFFYNIILIILILVLLLIILFYLNRFK
jgi:hypothetical protein